MHHRLETALRAQLARRRAALDAGARPVGWKIGGDIAEVDEVTGGEPTIGYLTTASQLEDGGVHSAAGAGALHADVEVAIEVGSDGAIAGLGVALELVDLDRPAGDLEAVVAANVLHRAFALGPTVTVTRADGATARAFVNGEVRADNRASSDLGDTVRLVAAQLEAVGERLRPGDRIIAGSVVQVAVAPGDEVAAEIDGLGRVTVTVAP